MNLTKSKKYFVHFFKKFKKKRYIRIIIKKERAEITVETAIVLTIIMLLLCSMIYCSLFLHDKVAIKSYLYAGLVEGADKTESESEKAVKKKIKKASLFTLKPSIDFDSNINKYKCKVSEKGNRTMKLLGNIMSFSKGSQTVEVVRKMPIEKMYLYKAIKDGIRK